MKKVNISQMPPDVKKQVWALGKAQNSSIINFLNDPFVQELRLAFNGDIVVDLHALPQGVDYTPYEIEAEEPKAPYRPQVDESEYEYYMKPFRRP